MMGQTYHAVANNCQKYCRAMFECIRIPNSLNDIPRGAENVPRKQEMAVVLRRCHEFLTLLYTPRNLSLNLSGGNLPLALGEFSDPLLDSMRVILLVLVYQHLTSQVYGLMVLMVILNRWISQAGIARLRQDMSVNGKTLVEDIHRLVYVENQENGSSLPLN